MIVIKFSALNKVYIFTDGNSCLTRSNFTRFDFKKGGEYSNIVKYFFY